MSVIYQLSLLAFTCTVPFYLHAFLRFYGIVKVEKPEWVQVDGTSGPLYDGLSRAADPNVQVEILRIAFSSRAYQLRAPLAASYAKRVRILLPVGLVLFVVGLAGAIIGVP